MHTSFIQGWIEFTEKRCSVWSETSPALQVSLWSGHLFIVFRLWKKSFTLIVGRIFAHIKSSTWLLVQIVGCLLYQTFFRSNASHEPKWKNVSQISKTLKNTFLSEHFSPSLLYNTVEGSLVGLTANLIRKFSLFAKIYLFIVQTLSEQPWVHPYLKKFVICPILQVPPISDFHNFFAEKSYVV